MKAGDLGFNLKTGAHDRRLTRSEERFVGILFTDHVGEKNCLSADVYAVRFIMGRDDADARKYLSEQAARRTLEKWKRELRRMYDHILPCHDNIPILSRSGHNGGYWMAESEEEAERFYYTFIKRGKTGLRKAVRGKQAALVEAVKQLSFEFEELEDHTDFSRHVRPGAEMPTPIEVVDAFLEKMLSNPEKFADGLRKIGEKYGSILLPREQVAALKEQAAELQQMVASLGG